LDYIRGGGIFFRIKRFSLANQCGVLLGHTTFFFVEWQIILSVFYQNNALRLQNGFFCYPAHLCLMFIGKNRSVNILHIEKKPSPCTFSGIVVSLHTRNINGEL
jgi:hypothetical protein